MKVYLSSTYKDLKDYRNSVRKTLCKVEGIQVVAMEDYVASEERPVNKCLSDVEKCDAYIGLFAWKYGFVPDGYDLSITNLEYQKAIEKKIPTFIFILDEKVNWFDKDNPLDNILNFRKELEKKHVVSFFENKEDLSSEVVVVISNHINKNKSIQQSIPHQKYQKLSEDRRNQLKLINKVRQTWIHDILDKSIFKQMLIEIGKEIRPEMLENPWGQVLEIPNHEPQVLPKEADLHKLFTKYENSLLILGEPGAGKTITLLTLARDLLYEAEQNPEHPVPFIVNLSSWAVNQEPLIDWLQKELHEKYYFPPRISRPWLEQQKMLPMLDGLDEVQAEHQKACAEAINSYVKDFGMSGLAVCCRIQEYETLKTDLCLNAAIRLQALDEGQVASYCEELGIAGLSSALEQDSGFLELARTPLMLNIMAMTYENETLDIFDSKDSLDSRRRKLFDSYINKVFKRRIEHDTSYSREIVTSGLTWLSGHMKKREQTIFLIENLQPDCLNIKGRILYHFIFAAICFLGIMPFNIVSFYIGTNSDNNENVSIFLGFFTFFCLGIFVTEIKLANKLAWSWNRFRKNWFNSILNRSFFMVMIGLLIGMTTALSFILFDINYISELNIIDMNNLTKYVIHHSKDLISILNSINNPINRFFREIMMSFLCFYILALPCGLIIQGLFWIILRQLKKRKYLKVWYWKKETVKSLSIKNQFLFWTLISLSPIIVGVIGYIYIWQTPGLILMLTMWLSSAFFVLLKCIVLLSLVFGIMFIILIGVPVGMTLAGLEVKVPDNKQESGYGIIMSLKNASKFTILISFICALSGYTLSIIRIPVISDVFNIDRVIVLVYVFFLIFGGLAVFQHYALRFTQYIYLKIPFKLAHFLDYATKLILMQKIGGGYIFIHRMLLEHFSSLQGCSGSELKKEKGFYADLGSYLIKIRNWNEQNKAFFWGIVGVIITLIVTVAIMNYSNLEKVNPDIVTSYNDLANLYKSQEKYNEAELLYKRSLKINETELGKDHLDVATSLNHLAMLYYSLGKYEEAEPLFQRCLDIREAELGKDHIDVGRSLINLANVYYSLEEDEKAETMYKRSLEILKHKHGEYHPDVATVLNSLAKSYEFQGKYKEAEALFNRRLEIEEAILGKDHLDVANSLNHLAKLYESQGNFEEAEPLFQRSLGIKETKLGKHHPDVVTYLNHLAKLYKSHGKYEEAESLYKKLFEIKYKEYLSLLKSYKNKYQIQTPETIVLVVHVVEGSQAQSIGIQKGDIIKSYFGNTLKTSKELIKIVSANANSKHKKINITIIRNGESIELHANPGRLGVQIETVDLSYL